MTWPSGSISTIRRVWCDMVFNPDEVGIGYVRVLHGRVLHVRVLHGM